MDAEDIEQCCDSIVTLLGLRDYRRRDTSGRYTLVCLARPANESAKIEARQRGSDGRRGYGGRT